MSGKPDSCPGRFCFHFIAEGMRYAPGPHRTVEEAFTASTIADRDSCGCIFGSCTRWDPLRGDRDWYEPDEGELRSAGLPVDFFLRPKN